MGGIAGIFTIDGEPEQAETRALAGGAEFAGPGAFVSARPRSTLASNDRFVVAVAGHFDRAPVTGQSAADTLLDLWTRSGVGALAHLEGAWVAAVLERQSRRIHLLRDPFGIRRLYFAEQGGRIAFSTSPKPLLDLPWVSREIAREHLAEYLSFRYVHAPRTLLRDVRSLPAGHHLKFDGRARMEPWFHLRYAPPYAAMPDDKPTLEEIERRLNRAVAARASGKERVGVFLSGGLDSSAITLFASRLGPVHTFTVGVQDADDDEVPYAGRVAHLLRAKHEVVRVDFEKFRGAYDSVIAASDEPITDPAVIPQFLLAQAAAQHVDVILAGDGGDEVFGGRMVGLLASQLRLSTWLGRMPAPARHAASRFFGGRRPEIDEPSVPFGLSRKIGGVHVFDAETRGALMRDPGWVRDGVRRMCLEPLYREVVSDPVNEILHVYLRGRMPEDALARTGTCAALAGIAIREPLLDRDLVAYCAGIPGPWKVRTGVGGATTKWPLREILRPVLSWGLVNRPKRVLPGPWGRWLGGPARGWLDERVATLREDPHRLFLPAAIDALVGEVDRTGTDARLWTLLFLDGWMREVGAT
ncbi:MAG: asparagine synthase-related protein [Pseudomonadota bacterium]|nr:asparagine synthase-related protein [Pseudomonadota bacterium]